MRKLVSKVPVLQTEQAAGLTRGEIGSSLAYERCLKCQSVPFAKKSLVQIAGWV